MITLSLVSLFIAVIVLYVCYGIVSKRHKEEVDLIFKYFLDKSSDFMDEVLYEPLENPPKEKGVEILVELLKSISTEEIKEEDVLKGIIEIDYTKYKFKGFFIPTAYRYIEFIALVEALYDTILIQEQLTVILDKFQKEDKKDDSRKS